MSQGLSWEAITAIGTLLGIVLTALAAIGVSLLGGIFKRLGELSIAMAKQQSELGGLIERWHECRDGDHKTHERLWGSVEEHERRLDDHERRIGTLEE